VVGLLSRSRPGVFAALAAALAGVLVLILNAIR
jgi:hypothetical protein